MPDLPALTTVTVFDPTPASVSLTNPLDYVSYICGDTGLDYCGARTSPIFKINGVVTDLTGHPFLSYDPLTQTLSAQTDVPAHAGTYVIDVEYGLALYAGVTPITTQTTFEIVDPCQTSVLDTQNPLRLTASEMGVAKGTAFLHKKDSSSKLYGGDGTTHCGPRVYTVTKDGVWPPTVLFTDFDNATSH